MFVYIFYLCAQAVLHSRQGQRLIRDVAKKSAHFSNSEFHMLNSLPGFDSGRAASSVGGGLRSHAGASGFGDVDAR